MAEVQMPRACKGEEDKAPARNRTSLRVKFEIYGEEIIDKKVMRSGASGRVYVPPDWENRHVKIIRID